MNYQKKYLLYKKKYIQLKNTYGGVFRTPKHTIVQDSVETPITKIISGIEEGLRVVNNFDTNLRFENIHSFVENNFDNIREERKSETNSLRNIISISRPDKDNIVYIFSLFNEKTNNEGHLKTGISLFPKSEVYFPT